MSKEPVKHYLYQPVLNFRCVECIDRLRGTMKTCGSHPSLVLFIFSSVPVGFAAMSSVIIWMVWDDLSFSPLFDNQNILLDSPTSTLKWMCFMSVVPFLFLIICVVEYYQWCNISFIRDLRANNRRKDALRFICFLLSFCIVYAPIAGLHIQIYDLMKNYEISTNDLLFNLQNFKEATYVDKMQVFFDCCGLYNYTDWGPDIPYSCYIDLQKPDYTYTNASHIFQKGCLKDISAFVNAQVTDQTFYLQVYCLTVSFILLLTGVISLHFARKIYYRNFKC